MGKIVAVHFWTINDTLRQYVKCECCFELLVVTVLSVSHLVAFIRVTICAKYSANFQHGKERTDFIYKADIYNATMRYSVALMFLKGSTCHKIFSSSNETKPTDAEKYKSSSLKSDIMRAVANYALSVSLNFKQCSKLNPILIFGETA